MIAIRFWTALPVLCAAIPAALFLAPTSAAAKHGVKSVEVGPIWNQMDADRKCPKAAHNSGGTWTGHWRTTRPGQMSECDITMSHSGWDHHEMSYSGWDHHGDQGHRDHREKSVEVGPIWNQMDAERKCPEAARKAGGTWNGQWRTTRPGQMSECDIKR